MVFDLESKCLKDSGLSLLLRGKEQAIPQPVGETKGCGGQGRRKGRGIALSAQAQRGR